MNPMNMQQLGALVMSKKRTDIPEAEKIRRKNEIEQQKKLQKIEMNRLYNLLQSQLSDRNQLDAESFLTYFGHNNFFKEYIQEGNKALVRQAFMKGDLQTFYKNQFVTRKGDKNHQFMLILEGQVGLYLEVADQLKPSKKQLIFIKKLIQGDTIEIGTLIDGQSYVMTTQAVSDTVQILSLNQNNFNKTFGKYESDKFDADLNFLKAVPFISDWPRRNLTALQMCISKFNVPRSQIIYQEGQPSHALFIVKKGEFGQFKKRHFWQRNENLEKGETVDFGERLKRMQEETQQVNQSTSSKLIEDQKDTTPPSKFTFKGQNKTDVAKRITGFLAGSVVEMNSDLISTFTVFDSFGEKELLNNLPRQYSIVCKSNQGELIQIKSRHFFIITQEDPELKFSVISKMMVDSKKQEIQNMRTNLTFRNENEMLLLDNHLNDIDDIETKVKMYENGQQDGSMQSTKSHPFHDVQADNLQHRSSFTLNKLSFNPNSISSMPQSNKQNTAHIYYEHRRQSKKQDNSQDPLANQIKQSRSHQVLQPQRKSVIISDLTQYLTTNNGQKGDTVTLQNNAKSKRSFMVNNSETQIPSSHSPIIPQSQLIRDFTNSPSQSSRNRIDSLQEIEAQEPNTLKLPQIKSNVLSGYTTKSSQLLPLNSSSYISSNEKGYSQTPNSQQNNKFNFKIRKSFNFGTDTSKYDYKLDLTKQQKSQFNIMNHFNTNIGLPANNYSSRPIMNTFKHSLNI